MKFSRVIGKIDPKLITAAEDKLSQVFLELGTRYDNEHVGSGMGGDPLIFGLMYPIEHVVTLNMPTAATDGKRFYWNPKFVIKQSRIGLRIVCGHEAWHAIYMHPQRRGSRNPKLWNIAIDYIVNGTVMDDFKARRMNAGEMFTKHLGKYMTLPQYAEMLKNPFEPQKGFEEFKPEADSSDVDLPSPNVDRELTPKEMKELERREKKPKFYYADPDLPEEMKSPEKIYDFLYNLLPKCPKCGRIGMYQMPSKGGNQPQSGKGQKSDQGDKGDQAQGQGQGDGQDQNDQHDHGDGQPCNCPDHQGQGQGQGQGECCGGCGGGFDIFGFGDTLDDHMDTSETEEKLAKRISDAMDTARKMAGHVPAALEDELGKLTAPKITWKDIIRSKLHKARAGNGRNDWTRFRTRPMFTGILVPKRRNYYAHFGCLLDTSGSMGKDDMAFGLSQLASLDDKSEGTIVPADAHIYWDKATKIKKAVPEELSKVKIVGRGGTMFASFFSDYEEKIGECDFLIVITDGYLLDSDVAEMRHPGKDVIWLITSSSAFKPPFGRVFDLHSV
jgi:predicted metal-dependent peptidase